MSMQRSANAQSARAQYLQSSQNMQLSQPNSYARTSLNDVVPQKQQQQQQQQQQLQQQQQSTSNLQKKTSLQNNDEQDQQLQQQRFSGKPETFKCTSILLFLASLTLTIYFSIVTTGDVEECSKLLLASKVNKYIWYTNLYAQLNYLILLWGTSKWSCLKFEFDLPDFYKSFNLLFCLCVIAGTIAMQITLNLQEKCGGLDDSIKIYLGFAYLLIVISFGYILYVYSQNQKALQSYNQQNQSNKDIQSIPQDSQRINQSNPYTQNNTYNTFQA